MKRLLSLILALIFCLGFIVSCENEEAPSSSSSSSSESSSDTESSSGNPSSSEESSSSEANGFVIEKATTKYYYKSPEYKLKDDRKSSNVYLVESKEHLFEIFEDLTDEAVDSLSHLFLWDENYEDSYIFVIEECGERGIWCELLGYKNLKKTDDGYELTMDVLRNNNHYCLWENSEAKYAQILPEPPDLYTLKPPYVCYAIVIPRSEFESQPSAYDIFVKQVVYDRYDPYYD